MTEINNSSNTSCSNELTFTEILYMLTKRSIQWIILMLIIIGIYSMLEYLIYGNVLWNKQDAKQTNIFRKLIDIMA